MKLARFVQPLALWHEPRRFVRKHHPAPLTYGWLQFRLFLYFTAGAWGCLELARLNPESPFYLTRHALIPGYAAGFSLLVIYISPFLNSLAPSIVRLFPNYIAVAQGVAYSRCFPFPSLSDYTFEKADSGWILLLSDIFGTRAVLAVPSDRAKLELEKALSLAKIPMGGRTPESTAAMREAIEEFRAKAQLRRAAARKVAKAVGSWFLGFDFLFLILIFWITFLHGRHQLSDTFLTVFCLLGLIIFFTVIIWMGRAETRAVERLIGDAKVVCPGCGKTPRRNGDNVHRLEFTLSCPSCGASLIPAPGRLWG